jgi:hypothetical protein
VLSGPIGAGFAKGETLTGVGTIVDDETVITLKPAKLTEGAEGNTGLMKFEVNLSSKAGQNVEIAYTTADSETAKNAAVGGLDYTETSGTLTIEAGQTKGFIEVEILGDALKEGDEVFNLVLSGPIGAGFAKGETLTGVGTIVDDETVITLKPAKLTEGAEGNTGLMKFEVNLSSKAGQNVEIAYTTADSETAKNAAVGGLDYTETSGTLTIEAGQTKGFIEVEILGDALKEGDEVFNLVLSGPIGAGFAKGETLTGVGTIVDDETVITLKPAKLTEGAEGNTGLMKFEVNLSSKAGQNVEIAYTTADNETAKNAAVGGLDYTETSGTLTIEAGQTKGFIEVEILGDALKEGDEVFNLVLSGPIGAGFAKGETLTGVGTIVDDETVITLKPAKLTEGAEGNTGLMKFEVNLSSKAGQNVEIAYTTADNETAKNAALAGLDYTETSGTLTIEAGQTKGFIEVEILGDALKEGDEVFNLVLSGPIGAGFAKGETLTGVGTIVDDETVITLKPAKLTEGAEGNTGLMKFEVNLSSKAGQNVEIAYTTADSETAKNAALAGLDYTETSGTLTIEAGQTKGFIEVEILGDALKEGDEVFNLVLSGPIGAGFAKGETLTGVGTIVDDETVITLKPAKLTEGAEGNTGLMKFEVNLSSKAGQNVEIAYTTADNETAKNAAVGGLDYTETSGTLTIEAGQTKGFIEVEILGDALKEGDEVFNLVLSGPIGAGFAKGETLTGVGTIVDDETVITLKPAKLTEGAEGNTGLMKFEVNLSSKAGQNVEIAYTTADSETAKNAAVGGLDYTETSGTLTIEAGQTKGFIEVEILGDALKEGDEVFNLVLSGPIGAGFAKGETLTGVGTIVDDETVITLKPAKLTEGAEGNTGLMKFEVNLSSKAGQNVEIAYTTADSETAKNAALAGLDYTETSGTLTIEAGQTKGFIEVEILGDALKEGDEVFNLVLSGPIGAGFAKGETLTGVGTIVDDETVITLKPAKLTEGAEGNTGLMKFEVNLSSKAGQNVEIAYTTADSETAKNAALAGLDYTETSGTLTIEAGQTKGFIEVEILGDALKEGDEVFNLVLSGPIGAGFAKGETLTGVGTIVDDETVITLKPAKLTEGAEGNTGLMKFEVNLSSKAGQNVEIAYTTADNETAKNAAVGGLDYTETSGTLTIEAGQTKGFIEVEILGDALKEGDEVFNLVLSGPIGAGFAKGETLTGVGTIVDDETVITLKPAKLTEGAEGNTGLMKFEVNLSSKAGQNVEIAYTTADSETAKNAALAGLDYTETSGTLTIEAGQTKGFIEVEILGDALKEGDEVFNLVLSGPIGAGFAKGETLTGVGTIVDDETVITLKPAKLTEGAEGNTGLMKFEVNLSSKAGQNVEIAYTTADSETAKNAAVGGLDYTETSGTLTIEAGQTKGFIEVEILGDALKEGDEVFNLVLSGPIGAGFAKGETLIAIGTIVDDEPIISF